MIANPGFGRGLRFCATMASTRRLEAVRVDVLAHLGRIPDAAVLGDVDARRNDCTAPTAVPMLNLASGRGISGLSADMSE